jgi:hypothetical protein
VVGGNSQVGAQELLDHADAALYQAKRAGRNTVGIVTLPTTPATTDGSSASQKAAGLPTTGSDGSRSAQDLTHRGEPTPHEPRGLGSMAAVVLRRGRKLRDRLAKPRHKKDRVVPKTPSAA